jgi:riboflavin kinase/FMN adenylyltransferase
MSMTTSNGPAAGAQSTHLQVWTGPDDVRRDLGPTALALGQFDGVHRGHQRLLERARSAADRRGIPAGVVTFSRHTSAVLAPGLEPAQLTTLDVKLDLLHAHGMDFAVVLPVTPAILGKSPLRFVSALLLDALRAHTIVVGPDFRFGRGAGGDPELLTQLTRTAAVDVVVMDVLTHAGERVSSTRIRRAVAEGRVGLAAELIGRSHHVSAVVTAVPDRSTALVSLDPSAACPAQGRYRVQVHGRGRPDLTRASAELALPAYGEAALTGAPGWRPADRLWIDFQLAPPTLSTP